LHLAVTYPLRTAPEPDQCTLIPEGPLNLSAVVPDQHVEGPPVGGAHVRRRENTRSYSTLGEHLELGGQDSHASELHEREPETDFVSRFHLESQFVPQARLVASVGK